MRPVRTLIMLAGAAGAAAAWRRSRQQGARRPSLSTVRRSLGASERDPQPGVPPAVTDDYRGRDAVGAQSFPASDPPAGW